MDGCVDDLSNGRVALYKRKSEGNTLVNLNHGNSELTKLEIYF